jgi:antitoxin HigA-1
MPMKNPPHPGELVRDNLESLGLSVAAAAHGLGVTRQQLHNVIAGRGAITPEMAVRLGRALGGGAHVWLRMQNAFDLARVLASGLGQEVRPLTPQSAAE